MTARDLYDASARYAADVVSRIDSSTYGRQSACEDWSVGEAINHLVGGQFYFALAARGEQPPAGEEPDFTTGDPVAALKQATAEVTDAFTDDVMAGIVQTNRGPVPGGVLFSIATMENVLHAWDAAKGAGVDATVPDAIGDQVLQIVTQIATSARGHGFEDEVEVPADAPITDRIVAMAGRQP